MTSEKKKLKQGVIDARGLVIVVDQTLESCEWPKINFLMRRGYSRKEAVEFLPKLASGEISDIYSIPDKPSSSVDKELGKK
jgi:hypothetical protein